MTEASWGLVYKLTICQKLLTAITQSNFEYLLTGTLVIPLHAKKRTVLQTVITAEPDKIIIEQNQNTI